MELWAYGKSDENTIRKLCHGMVEIVGDRLRTARGFSDPITQL